ncbi:MAG: hypothetical protein ABEJ64_04160 [Candidatus Nanohaloarchaea archaeon]
MSFHTTQVGAGILALAVVALLAWFLTGGTTSSSSGGSSGSPSRRREDSPPETSTPPEPEDTGGGDTPGTTGGGTGVEAPSEIDVNLSDEIEQSLAAIAENASESSASQDQQLAIENEVSDLTALIGGIQDILAQLEGEDVDTSGLQRQLQMIEQRVGQLSETSNNIELDMDNSQELEASLENVLVNGVVQELEGIGTQSRTRTARVSISSR